MSPVLGRLLCLFLFLLSACSPWQRLARYDDWSLYALPGPPVDHARFEAAFEPATRAVEEAFGPFSDRVAVHAWPRSSGESRVVRVERLPGGSTATVPAWHQRGGDWAQPEGIYVTWPDAGGAVHELIHAWFSLEGEDLPLWFEEGVAMFFGDGVLVDGEWVVDGLACWPWQQLATSELPTSEVERLFTLGRGASSRDDLYVHFVGWAAVFDLARETGSRDWRTWRAASIEESPPELAQRVSRTLETERLTEWLERLQDPKASVRLATALGTWKLASREVCEALLDAQEQESEPEVALALALTAAASTGEVRLPRTLRNRAWGAGRKALQRADAFLTPPERRAARTLESVFAGRPVGRADRERAWDTLRVYWDE